MGPRAEPLATHATELGEGEPGQILTGTITLRNIGAEPLDFTAQAGCQCADLSPRQGRVAPGDACPIRVGIRLRTQGRDESARVQIWTNDPDRPELAHVVTARCPAPFVVSPKILDFGPVVEGSAPALILTIRAGDGRLLPTGSRIQWSSDYPGIDLERVSGGTEFQLRARLRAAKPGSITAEICLNDEARLGPEMRVAVAAQVTGPVTVSPATLYLSRNPENGEVRPGQVLVWRGDGHALGSLRAIDAPAGVTVDDVSPPGASRRCFLVRIAAGVAVVDAATVALTFSDGGPLALFRIAVPDESNARTALGGNAP